MHLAASLRRAFFSLVCAAIALVAVSPQAWAGASTTTTLAVTSGGSAVTTIASGSVITLTATVMAGTAPVKPGTVNFCNAAEAYCTDIYLLGTAQLTSSGKATIKFRPGIGSHSYRAMFAGTTADSKSASAASALTVTGLHPSQTVIWPTVVSPNVDNFSVELGGNAGAAPSGMVTLLDTSNGNAVLGSARIYTYPGARFLNVLNFQIGEIINSVAVGDFNGDGIPDLAVTYRDSLAILLGNGDGTFTTKTTFPTIDGLESIAVGDFNGDGILDIAVMYLQISVFLGNGDGTFTPGVNLQGGGYPVVGDFNGDGNLDIATAGGEGLAVWLGKGDGTFASAAVVTGPAQVSARGVVAGDFNRDGISDIVVAGIATGTNGDGGMIATFLGNGDGTFTQTASIAEPTVAKSIVAGDFRHDGILDLAVTLWGNGNPGSVAVLLGKGDGTFTDAASPGTGDDPIAITMADFNQDGIPDLAIANLDGSATVLMGNGDGTFTAGPSPGGAGEENSFVATGDFDGDGVPDLATNYTSSIAAKFDAIKILLTENKTASAEFTGISVPGTHNIVARFAGDSNYAESVSQPTEPCKESPIPGACY